jgi:TonB-linked SusC/RagA family outer membrane protein
MKKKFFAFTLSNLSQNFEKQNLFMFFLALSFLFDSTAMATISNASVKVDVHYDFQQNQVSGKVTDKSGQPLPGVTIVIKGTTKGVITDLNGKYVLSEISPETVLVFSFVGMKSQEIEIAGENLINVIMQEETVGIEEVVAIGYGTQKKATTTGAISQVEGDIIKQSPATNLTNTLIGRLPGLTVQTPNSEPGFDDAIISIRGSNTLGNNAPLIVVDGIANREFARLSPSEIESIVVLKDASAAIYGSQAANGVILVTTKRGQTGKPTITADFSAGFNQPTILPDMADAGLYATMLNEIDVAAGRSPRYTNQDITLFNDGSDPWGHPNTDWFNEVLKTSALQHNENITFSGGNESLKFFISIANRFQDGYYKNSGQNYSQQNFRSNIDGNVSENIRLSFDFAGRQENRLSTAAGAPDNNLLIYRYLVRGKPTVPAYWPDGSPGPDLEYGYNPAVIATDIPGYQDSKTYVFEGNVRADITIPWVKGLSIQGNASYNKEITNYKHFLKPWYLYTWDGSPEHNLLRSQRGVSDPSLTQKVDDGYLMTLNALAKYSLTISDNHNINIMAGYERSEGYNSWFSAYRRNFVSDAIDQLFAGADDQYKTNNGAAYQSARVSYFGRANYDFRQKYLIDFVWRYDGSNKFAKGKQFGFFPGVSIGWRLSEENFWKERIHFINDFKLRASWGKTGNDRIEDYQYLSSYSFLNGKSYVTGNGIENKVILESRVPNPDVTWEVAEQRNIGFNAAFFDKKLYLEADYFNNIRSNILWWRNASLPATAGFITPRENIGEVVNQGFESVITFINTWGKLRYSISANGAYSKDKIVDFDETPNIPDYQKNTGHPMNTELFYQAIGIFQDRNEIDAYPHWANARPGDIIFKDVNEDGKINSEDMVRSDKGYTPRFIGGLNFQLQYNNFDLSIFFQGSAGAISYIGVGDGGEFGNYFNEYATNRWTEQNPSNDYPRTWNMTNDYWVNQRNTYWVESRDYLRLKNLEFGYNLPNSINEKLGIEGLRIYLNGFNLLTFSKSKIFDPETEDSWSYPSMRIINTGITLTF